MDPKHQQYLLDIEEASIMAREIADQNSHLDFMDLFHSLLNLKLSPEERLSKGLRRG